MNGRPFFILLSTVGVFAMAACGLQPPRQADAPGPTVVKTETTTKINPSASPFIGPVQPTASSAPPPSAPDIMSTAAVPPVDPGWSDPAGAKGAPEPMVPATDTSGNTDMSQRLDRLEKEVADMRGDMNMMMPALNKMVAAQQDLQKVLNRLDASAGLAPTPINTEPEKAAVPLLRRNIVKITKTDETHEKAGPPHAVIAAAPPQQPLIMPAQATVAATAAVNEDAGQPLTHDQVPPATAPASTPADNPNAAYSVSQIRFGAHANMTRVVLEASGKIPYKYSLNTDGTLMTVNLPETAWKASQADLSHSAIVGQYNATPDGQGGTMVAIRLKKPVTVSWADVLPPATEGGYRVVFDLTPRG